MSTGDDTYTGMNPAFDLALKQARELTHAHQGFQFVAPAAYQVESYAATRTMELESYRASKADELRAMMSRLPVTPELRAELEASIQSLGGATSKQAIDAMTNTISNQIADAASYTTSQTSLNDQEAREDAKRAEILHNLAAYEADSKQWREEFAEKGYGDTPENEKELADLWAEMKTYEPGSPEWKAIGDKIFTKNADYLEHVKEEALKRGDMETVKKADEAIKATQQAKADVQDLSEVTAQIDALNNQTKNIADGQENDMDAASFYGNDDLALTQAKPEFEKETVAKAGSPQEDIVDLGNLTPMPMPKGAPSGGRGIG